MGFLRRLRLPTPSLHTKLMVAIAVLVVVAAGGSATFLVERERAQRLRTLEGRATRIADLLEQSLAQALWNVDSKAIQRQLDALAPDPELAEVTVTAVGYGTVAIAGPRNISDATGGVVRVRPIAYAQFEGFPPQKIGEVRVVLTRAEAEAAIVRARRAIVAMAAAVALMLYAATSALLKRILQTPMTRLEAMVDRLAAGDLDARCSVDSADELGRLAERINVMADRLRGFTARLRESETRFRTFVDHATDAFFLHDDQLTVLDVNRQACESLGYSHEELIGVHLRDFDVGLDEASLARLAERVGAGETVTFESLHRRKDGTVFPVEIRARQFQQGEHRFRLSLVRDITERKRAEDALRRSEAYLAEAQQLSQTGSFAFDVASDKYVYLSEECFGIFGLGAQEGLPTREAVSRRIHPEDWDRVNASFEKLLREKVDTSSEFRIALPSGTVKHILAIRHPVLNSAGDVVRIVGTAIDMTERKRAQEALQRSEKELRTIVETIPAFIETVRPDGSVDFVSQSYLDYTGLSREEWLDWGWVAVTHPEDLDRTAEKWRAALAAGEPIEQAMRIRQANGEYRWFLGRTVPLRDEKGNIVKWYGTLHDVEDQKRAEEKVRLSEERFRAIADYTYDWENWIGTDGKLLWVNSAAERITGYSVDECLAIPNFPLPLVDEADREEVACKIKGAIQGTSENDFEFRVRHKDGHPVWVAASWQPIYDSRGGSLGHRSSLRDITERKRAEEELRLHRDHLEELVKQRTEELALLNQLVYGSLESADVVAWWIYFKEEDTFHALENCRKVLGMTPAQGNSYRLSEWAQLLINGKTAWPEYGDMVDQAFERFSGAISNKYENYRAVYPVVTPDGTLRWLDARADVPLRDEEGKAVFMTGTVIDITERKRAEERAEHLASYPRLNPSPIIEVDVSGTITFSNPNAHAVLEKLGLDKGDLNVLLPHDLDAILRDWDKKNEATFDREVFLADRVLSETIHLVPQFKVARIYALDITERKRAEDALRESEEKFRFLVQQVKDYAIFSLNAEGYVASWNAGAERIYGYRAEEIIGQHVSIFHAKDAIDLRKPWRILEIAAAEGQFKEEGWRIPKNRPHFWADVVITALRDEAGNLQGFSSVTRNIDERRKAEETLNFRLALEEFVVSISSRFINIGSEKIDSETVRALEEVRKFVGADRCNLFLLSPDKKTIARVYESCSAGIAPYGHYVDGSFESLPWLFKKLSQLEPFAILDATDLPPEADAEREHWRNHSMLSQVIFPLSSGNSLIGYLLLGRESEAKRWTPEDLGLVRLVGETLRNTFERIQSEAERRRLEDEVSEAQRRETEARLRENERMAALGQMASGIAHDIRNPINFVSLALDHLSGKKPKGPEEELEIQNLFNDAHSELVRVSEMIQGLLDYGRVQTINPEIQNASEILVESHKEITRRHPAEKLCISLEGVDKIFPILVDRDLLFRALGNLLENALEAGGPVGSVRAGVGYQTLDKSNILLWVEDAGPGIAEENLEKIFTPYFTTKKSGVGLGLTLTRKWVHEMGGKIQVHNGPGGGARFELSFPVVDMPADDRRGTKNETAIFELSQSLE